MIYLLLIFILLQYTFHFLISQNNPAHQDDDINSIYQNIDTITTQPTPIIMI